MEYLSPEESINVYEILNKSISALLDSLVQCKVDKNEIYLTDTAFRFDPRDFNKLQKLRLLRANSGLQFNLEKLSTIIELVPLLFKHYKVNEYT